ncbi:MAG: hypothetical protein Q7S79_03405 [bacterium]|nr:hypothetical protein [bacterium]
MEVIPVYLTILRLLLPFTILRWPLLGILAATFADMYDWKLINAQSPSDYEYYQNWDKLLDLYYLSFALIVVFRWREHLAKKLAILFFLVRVVGIGLFWLLGIKSFLFFFPNIFENFFIFYTSFLYFTKGQRLFTSWRFTATLLLSLIIPKLVHEYFMHYLGKQPWELYDAGALLGFSGIFQEYTNHLVFGTLFYIVPFLIFLQIAKKRGVY